MKRVILLSSIINLQIIASESVDLKTIKQSQRYQTFKAVQKIYDICEEIAKESNEQFKVRREFDKLKWFHQTKEGLYVEIATQGCPRMLRTPWGDLLLYRFASGSRFGYIATTKRLFERIEALFYCSNCEKYGSAYEVVENAQGKEFLRKELSDEEYENAKGTCKIISLNCWSRYAIHRVDEIVLEKPEMLHIKEYRRDEVMNAEWNLLKSIYEKELQENNKQLTG